MTWVHPRPQHYFEELLVNNQLDFQWKLRFKVDRETFEVRELIRHFLT